ncbi:unnamed protein product [Closterium sp. NIES-53]
MRDLSTLHRQQLVTGLTLSSSSIPQCISCYRGKQTRQPFGVSHSRTTAPLQLIHSDIAGPFSYGTTIGGARYLITFIDDYSRHITVYLLRHRSEAFSCFKDYVTRFNSDAFTSFLKAHDIARHRSTPYTPEQNGVAERANRRGGSNSKTPVELWTGARPDVSHLRIFGSPVSVLIPPQRRSKLDDRSTAGIMVRYGHLDGTKAYRIYIPSQHCVTLSRDVIFMEHSSPPSDDPREPPSSSPPPISSPPPPPPPSLSAPTSPPSPSPPMPSSTTLLPPSPTLPAPATSSPPPLFSNLPLPSTPQDFRLPSLSSPSSARPPPCTSSSSPPSPSAPSTLSLFSLLKVLPSPSEPIDFTLPPLSKTSANAALHHHYEPQTIHEARTGPNAAEWIKAAEAELAALHANDTYSVVPRPPKCKPIPCKWIFKVKEHADGSIERRKARLVVKGFKQRDGVDFHDTFAPTVRFATLRLFLTIAAAFDLEVHQLDISNAFLNGTLDEILYMMQPPAPRCWYRKLREELAAFRLFAARTDPGLFIAPPQSPYRPTAASFFMLLVYVDDLIILSSSSSLLSSFKRTLSSRFKLRDLGPLSYYLGFHITRDRTSRTLHLHQSKFITSILDTYSFTPLNLAATPMHTKFQLPVTSSPHSSFPYTSFVGSIMYAMVGSRPDLAYSAGVLARHLHDWSTPHVSAAKRIARYLKGTTSLGLLLGSIPNALELHGWCDASWGPEGELRRSVTCYLFFLGPSPISWQSKRQAVVATSSCEAEYYSLGAAVHEALWLQSLLTALGLPPTGSTRISCDNNSAIILAKDDGVFHPKAKHIDIKHHFIRDHVANHSVTLLYVPTQDNLADIDTKPLPRDPFLRIRGLLGLTHVSA